MPIDRPSAPNLAAEVAHQASTSEKQRRSLRTLFPHLSENELNEVAETLHGYCTAVWRIYERLKRERPDVVDELMGNRTIKAKVDSKN